MSQVNGCCQNDHCVGCGQYIGKTLHACMGPPRPSVIDQTRQLTNHHYGQDHPEIAENIRRANRGLAFLALILCLICTSAQAQQPAYALGWQPVMVPGQVIAVPRPLYVTNWLWGPRVYFVPQPPIPQQPLGPVR